MKYLVLIGDGMADYPLDKLGGKTPLEAAHTPNMDFMAQNGICGLVNTIPKGMAPGSDVAAMSIFGYNPTKDYTGRAPFEAASMGIKLKDDEIAFRCNLVSIKNEKMESFTAHQIKTSEANKIINLLNEKLGRKGLKFYAGLSYRNIMVIKSNVQSPMSKSGYIPPHDITGQKIGKYLPPAGIIRELMDESREILKGKQANMIWLWGQGKKPKLESFKKKFGLSGAVISAVKLLQGIGKTLGLEVIEVPGATGYLDTNYKGKAEYALKALKKKDIVFIHVEAPDEAGHEGSIKNKIKAIEDFDRLVVGTILKFTSRYPLLVTRILVLPDHPTPIKLMTHTSDAVPFAIYDSRRPGTRDSRPETIMGFNEKEIGKSKLRIKKGSELLKLLLSV